MFDSVSSQIVAPQNTNNLCYKMFCSPKLSRRDKC